MLTKTNQYSNIFKVTMYNHSFLKVDVASTYALKQWLLGQQDGLLGKGTCCHT